MERLNPINVPINYRIQFATANTKSIHLNVRENGSSNQSDVTSDRAVHCSYIQ